jgi:predicted PurR-regulated permease PerM
MTPSFERPFTFDRVMRILFSIIIIGGLILLITALRTALLPFLVAWLIAYILQPFVQFFQYRLKFKNRILSVMAVLTSFLIIVTLLVWSIIPSISDEIAKTINLFNTHSTNSTYIPFIPDSWLIFLQENFKLNEFTQYFNKENLLKGFKQLAPQFWSMLSNTFSWLLSITILFVTLLYIIFILLDYEKIANGWLQLMPTKYRPFISTLAGDVESNMKRYFRGQTAIALIVGVLLAIGFKIISFPLAVSLGLFIGFLNLIPYMQTIGIIPMLVLSLLKSAETGSNFWIIFGSSLLVLAIVQVIQDLILTPRIMGKAMGLNPAIILLSLSIWGSLLGFIGLIIALPLTTLVLSYYKRFILGEEANLDTNKQESIQEKEK